MKALKALVECFKVMKVKKKVLVEQYAERGRDESHYKGYIKINGTKLDYELKFPGSIFRLADIDPPKSKDELRHIIQITVKKDNIDIELTDEEYDFFYQMTALFVVEYYKFLYNEECRDIALQGLRPMMEESDISSLIIKSSGLSVFSSELCEMLNAPKFGCSLVA